MSLALPKSHPHANKPRIPLSLLKEEAFIGLNRMYPNYGDWLLKVCRRVDFKPRIVKEADGAASALAFVAAGFGVAVVSAPLQKIPAKDVIFHDSDSRGQRVGAGGGGLEAERRIGSRGFSIRRRACPSLYLRKQGESSPLRPTRRTQTRGNGARRSILKRNCNPSRTVWENTEKLNETLAEISVLQRECEVSMPSRRFALLFVVPAMSELHRTALGAGGSRSPVSSPEFPIFFGLGRGENEIKELV